MHPSANYRCLRCFKLYTTDDNLVVYLYCSAESIGDRVIKRFNVSFNKLLNSGMLFAFGNAETDFGQMFESRSGR